MKIPTIIVTNGKTKMIINKSDIIPKGFNEIKTKKEEVEKEKVETKEEVEKEKVKKAGKFKKRGE